MIKVTLLSSIHILHLLFPLFQTQAYKSVVRDPYSGDVAKVANTMKKELGLGPIDGETANKPCSRVHQGVRDLHESSFSLSGRLTALRLFSENLIPVLTETNVIVFCICILFRPQVLRLMTTSRRGPRLVSWPLLAVAPVVFGK